eukprot:NODE_2516_length_1157_cov_23.187379_g2397_i0.p1 GENE.NODE_2516_length_1157_cov_23.187379_g2397_i0~~NODE_2516_length_1157_cov_23.187379_g2397_i0.p1  ORF type:complete len:351 (-),score=92.08 NODE_2516_length_1157_cov_23.187379_g2397_i0:85-1137(-)
MTKELSAASQSRSDEQQNEFQATSDFANYFCTYEFLYHQKQMLEDRRRMVAYHTAIFQNAAQFKDKIVLDVGAGSGILSIWAAKAGAKRVYGVEATKVAMHARRLVESNGCGDVVEIIQSTIEDIDLPTKVDIIISEWMGYFLLRESMLDSVLMARDRWLAPGGALYPSKAQMFLKRTKENFGVDMDVLTPAYRNEQHEFYLQSSVWMELTPRDMIAKPCCIKEFDLATIKVEDFRSFTSPFTCEFKFDTRISAFAGWFTTDFAGSVENPATTPTVVLDTSPEAGHTHWGQQVFLLYPPLCAQRGNAVTGTIEVTRRKDNQRLLEVKIVHQLENEGSVLEGPSTHKFHIQ